MDWKEAANSVPKTTGGGYMKFKQGANKFRILSAPVSGFELWTSDNKPIRTKSYPESVPADIRGDSKIKFFWAFCVWNFETKTVEILELTQTTIINAIQDLINAEEWGDPTGYSLTVNKKGEKLDTEYSVVPSPAQATPADILKAYEDKAINLEALFTGANPFERDIIDL